MVKRPSKPKAKWPMKQRVLGQLMLGSIFGILFLLYRFFVDGEPYTMKSLLTMAFIIGPIAMLLAWVRWTLSREIGRERRAARKIEREQEQMEKRKSESPDQ